VARARNYLIPAALAFLAILASKAAPVGGARVPDSNGLCCVEPTHYFLARVIGDLSPVIVGVCAVWMLAIWLRSCRS